MRKSRPDRPGGAWLRALGAVAACAAGMLAVSAHLGAQQQLDPAEAAKEVRAAAELQRKILREEEPQLARRLGKGSPQYLAALHARLEAHSATALPPVSPAEPRNRARSLAPAPQLTPPAVFPIYEDPRTAKALAAQQAEILQPPSPSHLFKVRMLGARPTVDEAGKDHFPHTVALRPAGGSPRQLCSGVLVHRRAVLTAQHCICLLNLGVGSEVHFGTSVDVGVVSRVARVASLGSCPVNPGSGNDLALLFLEPRSAPVDPVNVGKISQVAPGSALWVAGFGEQEDHKLGQKLTARIGVVSPTCSDPLDPGRYGCVARREAVLLDSRFGRDSCYGDSGGPAYIEDPRDGKLHLVAIVARGIRTSSLAGPPCGQGGVYTLLAQHVLDWLFTTLVQADNS